MHISHKVEKNILLSSNLLQPTCGCFGGGAAEPDDAGAENENDRREWLDFMQNACDWAKGKT